MSWNPPINSWPQRDAFRGLLQKLEQLSAPSRIRMMAATSREVFNFYCSAGTIEAAFQNWFFEKYNTQGQQFAWSIWRLLQENRPQTNTMIDSIEHSEFVSVFRPDINVTAMNRSLPVARAPDNYLRAHLNSAICAASASNERKDAAIEMVLKRPATNDFLRARLSWLLPPNATLCDIWKNCSESWHPLIAALCEVAERANAVMHTSFPILAYRKAVEEAVKDIQLPFLERIMHNPLETPETRAAIWMAAAPNAIQQAELCDWLGEVAMATEPMSQEQMNLAFADLMQRIDADVLLCDHVVKHVTAQYLFPVPHFEILVRDLFAPQVPATPLPQMQFTKPGWVSSMLTKLRIVNSQVEKHLHELENEPELLAYYTQENMPSQLMTWGATGLEHVRITNAMVQAGLIAAVPQK